MPTDNGGTRSRSGGMSVSLASPDGRVVGGGVAGLLVAASPVQVILFFTHSRFACYKIFYLAIQESCHLLIFFWSFQAILCMVYILFLLVSESLPVMSETAFG